MTASWPESDAIPVFRGNRDAPELVGYTTFRMRLVARRFMMTEASPGPGAMFLVGEAEIIERTTEAGTHFAWLVVTGDYQDLPGFSPTKSH